MHVMFFFWILVRPLKTFLAYGIYPYASHTHSDPFDILLHTAIPSVGKSAGIGVREVDLQSICPS